MWSPQSFDARDDEETRMDEGKSMLLWELIACLTGHYRLCTEVEGFFQKRYVSASYDETSFGRNAKDVDEYFTKKDNKCCS